ncbi:MAG: FMN-dependent NADH-azoreductase [Hyphomicrobiales bacterium]|nr:NAD(P)H-dependent oxidoreductase [Hyphomicrobiales bacterium]PCH49662.1 MAG: FMN-dependent NADH-azoreductase [Hyphomicrobiales bacterium]
MSNKTPRNILKINSSARYEGSISRGIVDELIEKLTSNNENIPVVDRDVIKGIEFIDETWVSGNFTQKEARSEIQINKLSYSDALVEEIITADTLVIGVPIYNFGIPAPLKAWFDQIARSNLTFKFIDTGPVGLMTGKKAYVVITSGGTQSNSEVDYATGYMKQVLEFIGIEDVEFIIADQLLAGEEAKLKAVHEQIAAL